MRTVEEMRQLILDVAEKDERIRGVVLNGSRANPNALRDQFMDYDIVYYVDDFESFPKDNQWIDVFGKRFLMQTTEDFIFHKDDRSNVYVWLMLFEDGNRIDLTIKDVSKMVRDVTVDSDGLALLWLDKDNRVDRMPTQTEAHYYVKEPNEAIFNSCMNEFFWLVPSVIKGLKRSEITDAMVYVGLLRQCLEGMIDWYIGAMHSYRVSVGKHKKYYHRLLETDAYEAYLDTYAPAKDKAIKETLVLLMDLFKDYGHRVAKEKHFTFDDETHEKVSTYIKKML